MRQSDVQHRALSEGTSSCSPVSVLLVSVLGQGTHPASLGCLHGHLSLLPPQAPSSVSIPRAVTSASERMPFGTHGAPESTASSKAQAARDVRRRHPWLTVTELHRRNLAISRSPAARPTARTDDSYLVVSYLCIFWSWPIGWQGKLPWMSGWMDFGSIFSPADAAHLHSDAVLPPSSTTLRTCSTLEQATVEELEGLERLGRVDKGAKGMRVEG